MIARGDVIVLRTRGPCEVVDVRDDGSLLIRTSRVLEPYERWLPDEIEAELMDPAVCDRDGVRWDSYEGQARLARAAEDAREGDYGPDEHYCDEGGDDDE